MEANEVVNALLKKELAKRTTEGWIIVSQTETTAQLTRKRGGLGCGVVGFVLLPLVLGFVIHSAFYAVAVAGLVLIGIVAMVKKDDALFIDGYDLALKQPRRP